MREHRVRLMFLTLEREIRLVRTAYYLPVHNIECPECFWAMTIGSSTEQKRQEA